MRKVIYTLLVLTVIATILTVLTPYFFQFGPDRKALAHKAAHMAQYHWPEKDEITMQDFQQILAAMKADYPVLTIKPFNTKNTKDHLVIFIPNVSPTTDTIYIYDSSLELRIKITHNKRDLSQGSVNQYYSTGKYTTFEVIWDTDKKNPAKYLPTGVKF